MHEESHETAWREAGWALLATCFCKWVHASTIARQAAKYDETARQIAWAKSKHRHEERESAA